MLGRPKNFDAFRKLCQKICHEKVIINGEVMTRIEVILRDWSESKDPQKQIALVQYGFGKPVDKLETTGLENKTTLVLHWAHERERVEGTGDDAPAVNGAHTPLLTDAE
jgi:hypothetical protein